MLTDAWRRHDVAIALRTLVSPQVQPRAPELDALTRDALERARALHEQWFDTPAARSLQSKLNHYTGDQRDSCESL